MLFRSFCSSASFFKNIRSFTLLIIIVIQMQIETRKHAAGSKFTSVSLSHPRTRKPVNSRIPASSFSVSISATSRGAIATEHSRDDAAKRVFASLNAQIT